MKVFIIIILTFLSIDSFSQIDSILIKIYYPDKSKVFETYWINRTDSSKNGEYIRFNSYGKIYVKGFYRNNQKIGIWDFYNKYSGYKELFEKFDFSTYKEIYNKDSLNMQAHFPGGQEELNNFILSKRQLDNFINIKGKVFISITIDTLGNLIDTKISRGLRTDIDKALIDILKNSPKWISSTKNGLKIKETLILPIDINK